MKCSDCKVEMIPTGFTNEEWGKMSSDLKHAAIREAIDREGGAEDNHFDKAESSPMEEIQKDIRTIKNILIFYLVISIIGAIIILTTIAPLFR